MFSNIGWAEIFGIMVVALIVIGPERLPGVVKDVRAAIYAARKAIANARAELDGEFGEEFREFKQPIAKVAEFGRMGPRGMVTKALFDDDDTFLDSFDPKKIMAGETAGSAHRAQQAQQSQQASPRESAGRTEESSVRATYPRSAPLPQRKATFSWEDVT